jgi:hypothetical protein
MDSVNTAKTLIAPPIYYRYGADGQADPAKPPSKFLQLVEFDRKIKTTFKVPTGRGDETRNIEPELLFHKTIICVPTYWAKRFFVGANASIQIYLESAIVVDIVEQVNAPVQSQAIRSIVEANPEAVERMNRMLGITSSSSSSKKSSGDDTFGSGAASSTAGDSPSLRGHHQQRIPRSAADDTLSSDLPDWVKDGSGVTSSSKAAVVSTATLEDDSHQSDVADDDENEGENAQGDDKFSKALDSALTSTSLHVPSSPSASGGVDIPPVSVVRRVVRKTVAA